MENKISLRKELIPSLSGGALPPECVVKQAILDNPHLKDHEDYYVIGTDIYLCLKALVYVTGRFAVTDTDAVCDFVKKLAVPVKKSYSFRNDPSLPQLTTEEQEWNDGILPIIRDNANHLDMQFKDFIGAVYREMHINFPKETGDYLDRVDAPIGANVTKFRVVTCNKRLRIKFEQAMARVISAG